MSGAVYGIVNCYSTGSTAIQASEHWKTFWDFMITLESASYVTRIAHHSGTGAVSGASGYWDSPARFGQGAFGVWKWNTSSVRPFEWYMCVQVVSGTSAVANEPQTVPSLIYGIASWNSSMQGLIFSAAVCTSGTSSFNPWNGSMSMGAATKSNPVWVSGANNRSLAVFPRSNSPDGAHQVTRSNTFPLYGQGSQGGNSRIHLMADADGFLAYHAFTNTSYAGGYIGAYKVRSGTMGLANSSYSLVSFQNANSELFQRNAAFGTSDGTSQVTNGGIAFNSGVLPNNKTVFSGKIFTHAAVSDTTMFPCTFNSGGSSVDEFPITVAVSEAPIFGIVGHIDSPLLRYSLSQNENVNSTGTRAWFTGNVVPAQPCVTSPWNGVIPPGTGSGAATSRTGSLLFIANPT